MECSDCVNLSGRYEWATFDVSRVQSALDVAERMSDFEAIQLLTMEACRLNSRQRDARAALATHRDTVHKAAASEFGSRFLGARLR